MLNLVEEHLKNRFDLIKVINIMSDKLKRYGVYRDNSNYFCCNKDIKDCNKDERKILIKIYENMYEFPVTVTEKLSNNIVAVYMKKNNETYSAYEINICYGSFTHKIWSSKNKNQGKITELRCMCGDMNLLPSAMLIFVMKFMNHINVSECVVFGEILNINDQKNMSWHPTGYIKINCDNNYERKLLTSKTLEEFWAVSKYKFKTRQELYNAVKTIDDHIICPPPYVNRGELWEVINSLTPNLIYSSNYKDFNGFILCFDRIICNFPECVDYLSLSKECAKNNVQVINEKMAEYIKNQKRNYQQKFDIMIPLNNPMNRLYRDLIDVYIITLNNKYNYENNGHISYYNSRYNTSSNKISLTDTDNSLYNNMYL